MKPATTLLSLPVEIRCLIYREILPKRLITVSYGFSCLTLQLYGRLLPPAIFQVCRQIRMESLSSYKGYELASTDYGRHRRHLNVIETPGNENRNEKVFVYISYIYDIIYIPSNIWDITYFMDYEFTKGGLLAVAFDEREPADWYINLRTICERNNIKELLFVVQSQSLRHDINRSGSLCDLEQDFRIIRRNCRTVEDVTKHIDERINTLELPLDPDIETGKVYRREPFFHRKGKATDENEVASCYWSLVGLEWDNSSITRRWAICTRFSG